MIRKGNFADSSSEPPFDPGAVALTPRPRGRWTNLLLRYRLPLLVACHILLFTLIYWLSLAIRFETFQLFENSLFWPGLLFVVGVKLATFVLLRCFHGWWRYVTFSDMMSLVRAAAVSMIVLIVADYFLLPGFQVPRSVIVIDCAFTIACLGALRSSWRLWDERLSGYAGSYRNRRRALLVGCDVEAARLAHLINSRPSLGVRVIGLVSAERQKPVRFSELKVLGPASDIAVLCRAHRARTIYIPAGSLTGKNLRALVEDAGREQIDVHVVPRFGSLLELGTQIPLRPVNYEDLLRRDPVELDGSAIRDMVSGKVVLVTGAGGSIGSEICRQLLQFQPGSLLLLGRGENRLFHLQNELNELCGNTKLVPVLTNVTDADRVREVFATYRPNIVFHAAAHKHVPLIEGNVGEALHNNIYGSMVVADAASEFGTAEFVLVSTDKAVRPTSVMGCTKQLAERYCLALGNTSQTRFVVTRFGNVLGSEGSVIPLFQKQIARGGPITVTDPEMVRFFMTIPEAAQLVLQAAAMGRGGEVFVLEMGQPVKIVDLARDLIRIAGLSPDVIDIVYSGIRPGEKLYEELYDDEEKPLPTRHKQILSAYSIQHEHERVREELLSLLEIRMSSPETIRKRLKNLVPEYTGSSPVETDDDDHRILTDGRAVL